MKQINDKLNKIAKAIDETVELPETNLITDSLDAITKALGGTPNDSNLIVDKLDDIAGVAEPKPTGNIELTENGENIDIAQYATATVNVSGGGGSNEEYVILPAGEYPIDPDVPLPLIAGLPSDADYITVKIAGEDYIFEFTDDIGLIPDMPIPGYCNSDFSYLAFVLRGSVVLIHPIGSDTPETITIDEIRAKPNDYHYFILTATIVNLDEENSIHVDSVFTTPEKILCLENGNIVDKTEEEIPAGSSLVLNIIVGSNFSPTGTYGGRPKFTITGTLSDLNNCQENANVLTVIPDAFPVNGIASVTITVELPK